MAKDIQAMSPSEVVDRIRELQEKESDMYNQIQDVNDFFQGFLEELEEKFQKVTTLNFFEIAEYTNLKERFQELEESGEASDSEIEDFEDLIGKSIENQNDAEEKCEQLTSIAKKLTHLAIKIKNEINISRKNQ
ncbi:MAG: hypothetical protein HG453_006195 [Clostridiales bacterium]|jgi:hypothetical protein|nr:hypothetical protein [Clostridiales bacterium]MBB1553752.1 hypothetical protein [Clostridiales bacterium]